VGVIFAKKKSLEFKIFLLSEKQPLEINLQGTDKDEYGNTYSYVEEMEAEKNDSFGCGLFYRDDGKIFRFYKKNNEISSLFF
jgi:hypothetical protein